MKSFFINLIKFYQHYISRHTTPRCVFYPTCSAYGVLAIEKYGPLKGSYLTFRRILRCHPWQKNHIDPLV